MDISQHFSDIEIHTDKTTQILYATDASVYRELPRGVIFPKNDYEIQQIVSFCNQHSIPLILRGAGTSLAGQVVGSGYVMDLSRHMTRIVEINPDEHWAWVEPGVVLDTLNSALKPYGLFFGPETSTSSRCTVGGMVGNNSCGSHSLLYRTTREHLLEAEIILSDGTKTTFKPLSAVEFQQKLCVQGIEGDIYRSLNDILGLSENRDEISRRFPHKSLYRRNSGYAIDLLADAQPFNPAGEPLNLCKILAGSEGTLAVAVKIKLNLVPLPPSQTVLVCAHFASLEEALKANLVALKHNPGAVELMDDKLLTAASRNIAQQRNRFFIQGEPAAVLAIEMSDHSLSVLTERVECLINDMKQHGLGYHFPVISGNDISRVWALRKAGLGVLTNIPGDAKPVTVIEDTAVPVEKLPDYIADLKDILRKYNLDCVFHAHVGSGELHLRPVLNLKDEKDRKTFRALAYDVTELVKKYRGSLSGEHGDGRLRSELLSALFGERCYAMLEKVKLAFDPNNILNPGKKVFPVPMDQSLRYNIGHQTPDYNTMFDFSHALGWLRAVEMCNGSADCRRSNTIGGFMCPTYMATLDERFSTRARANLLRERLTSPDINPLSSVDLYHILDCCIACKACKSECPSNIDMTKFKAEFLWNYHQKHGISLRTRLFMHMDKVFALASAVHDISAFFIQSSFFSRIIKKMLRIAPERRIPVVAKKTLRKTIKQNFSVTNHGRSVFLFVDEFTNYTEVSIGVAALRLLQKLGYQVKTVSHPASGRTYLSKGNLKHARRIAQQQVEIFYPLVSADTPLLGVEPSAILSFRDEYPDLLRGEAQKKAKTLATHCLLVDEFLVSEYEKGNINQTQFDTTARNILLHVHCQQKALVTSKPTVAMLKIPVNHSVSEIASGCCGMAGAFGYEKEHYKLSMQIGEQYLFPAVREADENTLIAANGTSCRQQILDGTGKKAFHPLEIMAMAVL